jgi:hypothetical protein
MNTPRTLRGIVRDLHLYVGLFLSPFVLVFAVSVFFLAHAWLPKGGAGSSVRTVADVAIPEKGREQVVAARAILDRVGVGGEIGFVRYLPRERRISLPVSYPGHETAVEIDLATRVARISSRPTGTADALVYLHKMPGPHNVAIRGNAGFMRVWRGLADATVYLLLFLSLSGVYLWALARAERRVGFVMLLAGAGTMGGMIYALAG